MIEPKNKKQEFEDFAQEVIDAVDEAFDEITGEVADIIKDFVGERKDDELHRKQKDTSENNK